MKAKTQNSRLAAYVAVVGMLGAGVTLGSWLSGSAPAPSLSAVIFWFALMLAAELFWVELPGRRGMISMSLAVNLAVLLVLPRPHAVTLAAGAVFASDLLIRRRGLLKAFFNSSQTAVAMFAASLAMGLVGVSSPLSVPGDLLQHPMGLVVTMVVFSVVNTGLVAGVLAAHQKQSLLGIWSGTFGTPYQLLSVVCNMVLGFGLLIAVESVGYVSGIAALPFLFILRDAYREFVEGRLTAATEGVSRS